jgi:hypothetical protein
MIRTARRALLALLAASAMVSASAQDDTRTSVATGPEIQPRGLRIMHAAFDGADLRLEVALVDTDERPVAGRTSGIWTAAVTCRDSASGVRRTIEPVDRGGTPADRGVSAVICLDHSAAAGGLAANVASALRALGPGLADRDSVGVIAYDHDLLELLPVAPAASLRTLSDTALPAPIGLSGTYSAMMAGLGALRDQGSSDLDLIVVTATDDNASIPYDVASVVRRAREGGVRINVIRLGTSSMGYVARYMAGATGGRAVQVPADGVVEAANSIRQILMARRQHVVVRIPVPASYRSCSDLNIGLSLATPSGVFSDSMRLPNRERNYRPLHTIVATFANGTDTTLGTFRSQIAMLAEMMSEDTTLRIDLVGHVDRSFKGNAIRQGASRARRVADALIRAGIASQRIQVRSEGTSRPLYYFELLPWQQRMNGRVDVRRLTGDELPFTIVVDQVATEEHAATLVDAWETRGYQAYFDPIVTSGQPAYRIVLWGYATADQAKQVARTVRSTYKTKAIVE